MFLTSFWFCAIGCATQSPPRDPGGPNPPDSNVTQPHGGGTDALTTAAPTASQTNVDHAAVVDHAVTIGPVVSPGPDVVGFQTPTAWLASSPTGHWTALCEVPHDTDGDGKLHVRVTPRGLFEGDSLRHVLYVGDQRQVIDEFAGADPSGRYVAYVHEDALYLLDTVTHQTLHLPQADTRASQASYQSLRSVAFSDDGRYVAYLLGASPPRVVLRDLTQHQERRFTLPAAAYRITFAPGGRFLRLSVPRRDTNKNGRLDWQHPLRRDPAPCPSPLPTYNVWEFPGDVPDTDLLDVKTGEVSSPEGFAAVAGDVIVRRTDDRQLIASTPGRPAWTVSAPECNGRVHHIDPTSGVIVYGCSRAWGQRRDMFSRTPDARIRFGFDLAAFELDAQLPTSQPTVAFYPGNQAWLIQLRTRQRWQLLDGTHVHAVAGTTALIELNQELTLVGLNPDGSHVQLSPSVKRPAFSSVLQQGPVVAVGNQVFDLEALVYAGEFDSPSPLALTRTRRGLFAAASPIPTSLPLGPLHWRGLPSTQDPGKANPLLSRHQRKKGLAPNLTPVNY